MTEDEMVGWHYRLDGHEFEEALGVGDRQGSLACCSPQNHKESDMTVCLTFSVRYLGSIPDLGGSPGGGHGNLLQYSCLGISWAEEPDGLQSMGTQRVGYD